MNVKPLRPSRDGSKKRGKPGNRGPLVRERGYCYLALFEAYNRTSAHKLDVSRLKVDLGPYPLFRRVAGILMSHARFNLLLPGVFLVSPGLYHVDERNAPMTLQEIVLAALGTDFRIGGLGIDAATETRAAGITAVSTMCDAAGVHVKDFLTEAARKQLTAVISANDSIVRDALAPLVAPRQSFHIPYQLDAVATSQLQSEYPELSITTGTTSQPHAYAAAARIAAEELILRKIGYSQRKEIPAGQDAFVVDIGANHARHATRGRFNIHCCSPIIDIRDSARETTRVETLNEAYTSGKLTAAMRAAYLNKNGTPQRCYQRGELCNYRAKYAMMIHSQYDVSLKQLTAMLDAHQPMVLFSVVNFVPSILYAEHGTHGLMGLNWYKSDGMIHFDFVNDPSMGYAHNERSFIEAISAQVIVTQSGRVYVCERFTRGDALFLQYTYCRERPETMTLYAEFSLWDKYTTDRVVISTWDYDFRRFADSKIGTPTNPKVRFTRRFIEVDARFYDMLYTHCIRSGDKSFNFNEVFSAASTFNTKMSINGNDVRAVNRVPTSQIVLAVMAVYCIAYRDRYQAGKTIESFVACEKDARNAKKIGLTALMHAAWVSITDRSGLLNCVVDAWNAFVTLVAEKCAKSDLDVRMLEAVRCVKISEFMRVHGEFDEANDPLMDPTVAAVEVSVNPEGVLDTVLNVMKEKFGDAETKEAAALAPVIPMVQVRPAKKDATNKTPPLQRVFPHDMTKATTFPGSALPFSGRVARSLKNNFHMNMSKRNAENSSILSNLRKSDYSCGKKLSVVPVPADGNCLYSALAYYAGTDAASMRRLLYDAMPVKDEDVLLMDGSRKSWGSTDMATLFSKLYRCRICIHMEENGARSETQLYTDHTVPETAPVHHLRWKISGDLQGNYSAHVDVLVVDEVTPEWQTMFSAVRLLPHSDTDEYRTCRNRQQLKGLSLIDQIGLSLQGLSVLELGAAPGAWTRLFLPVVTSTGGEYHAVSRNSEIKFAADVLDFECPNGKLIEADALTYLIKCDHSYDLIMCDVADDNSWIRGSLQHAIMHAAPSKLRKGGSLIMKLSNVLLSDADAEMSSLKELFTSVVATKPAGSRWRNSEFYVVASGYGCEAEFSDPVADRKAIAPRVVEFCISVAEGAVPAPLPCDELYASLCEEYLTVNVTPPAPERTDTVFQSFLTEVLPKSELTSWGGLAEWLRATKPQGDMHMNILEAGIYSERHHYDYDELVTRFAPNGFAYLGTASMPPALTELMLPLAAGVPVLLSDKFDLAHLAHKPALYIARLDNPSEVPASVDGYPVLALHRCRYTPYDDFSVYLMCTSSVIDRVGWRVQLGAVIKHAVADKPPVPLEVLKYALKSISAGGIIAAVESLRTCPEHVEALVDCVTCQHLAGCASTPDDLQAIWRRVRNYLRQLPSESVKNDFRLFKTITASESKHMDAWSRVIASREQGGIVGGKVVPLDEPAVAKFTRNWLPNATCGRAAKSLEPGIMAVTDPYNKERIVTNTYGVQSQMRISFHGARGPTSATTSSKVIASSSGTVRRTHATKVSVQPLPTLRDASTSTTSAVQVITYAPYTPIHFNTVRSLTCATTQTQDDAQFPMFAVYTDSELPELFTKADSGKVESLPDLPGVPRASSRSSSKSSSSSGTSDTPPSALTTTASGPNSGLEGTSCTSVTSSIEREAAELVYGKKSFVRTAIVAVKRVAREATRRRRKSGSDTKSLVSSATSTIDVEPGDSSFGLGSESLFSHLSDSEESAAVTDPESPVADQTTVQCKGGLVVQRGEPVFDDPAAVTLHAVEGSAEPFKPVQTTVVAADPSVTISRERPTPTRTVSSGVLIAPPVPAPRKRSAVVSTLLVDSAHIAPDQVEEVELIDFTTPELPATSAAPPVPAPRRTVPPAPTPDKREPVVNRPEEVELVNLTPPEKKTPSASDAPAAGKVHKPRTVGEVVFTNSRGARGPKPTAAETQSLVESLRARKLGIEASLEKATKALKSWPALPKGKGTSARGDGKPTGSDIELQDRTAVDMATVRDELPISTTKDTLVTKSIWTAFPNDCKVHLALCACSGDSLVLPPGLAKRIGDDIAHVRAVRDAGFVDLRAPKTTWSGMWRHQAECEIIVPVCGGDHEAVLRSVLEWMPKDVARVAIESSVDLGDAALVNLLRDTGRRVCLVESRTRKWAGVMHMLAPAKHPLPTKTKTVVFPKLTREGMGLGKEPPWIRDNCNLDKYRNSMIEFKHLTANSDNFNRTAFRDKKLHPKNGPASEQLGLLARAGFNVYDQETQSYLVQTPRQKHSHAYSPSRDTYVPWDDKKRKFLSADRYLLVSRYTEIMLNKQISETIAPFRIESVQMPEIIWINGPPGCGKTYTIVQTTTISTSATEGKDLVLSMTTEGKLSVQAAVRAKNGSLGDAALKAHIRTVASLLVNGTRVTYDRVLIDEALMAHAGIIGFVAALTRTSKILIIGDIHQIPYVDRDHMCTVKYYSPACFTDITSYKEITYRCPIDATFALSDLYPNFCTNSTVVLSMRRMSYAADYSSVPKDLADCLYLCHYQSDKDALVKDKFGVGRGSRVLTIHEAQGLTFRHVICIRTSPRPLDLYDSRPYAVVAISRHTQSFRYYTDHDDAITKFIARASILGSTKLIEWNAPRLAQAKERVAREEAKTAPPKITAGGIIFEGDSYLRPLDREFDDALVKGLPAVYHLPLVPVEPVRVKWGLFARPAKYKMVAEEDINYLQTFYDSAMPGIACIDYSNDQMLMEYEDTMLFSTDLEVMPTKGVYRAPKYGKLRPRIRTIMQARKVPSQKESLLGAMKRNLNAPELTNQNLSPEVLGEKLFENFILSGIDQTKLHLVDMFQKDPITISSPAVALWLERQPPARRAQIVSDLPLHLRPYNMFSYMVKADVKPQLSTSAQYKYPSVQTIVYNDPSVNAIFCPIYNLLFERLLAVLHPKVLMFTAMSSTEFEQEVNARLDARVASMCKKIENDFSKYDKAQQAALRTYERKLWEYVGLDPELSQIWDDSRKRSTVTDRRNGVRFTTQYQRKSGEATTFSGNTLVALGIVLAVMNIDDIALVMVAGDDSLVYLKPDADFSDSSQLIADLFNLECKLLQSYKVPYFCSKFLVTTDDWTYVVHDPLKFVTKLGRLDMSNFKHVEEYRVSCVDTMKSLFNPVITQGVSLGVLERYGGAFGDLTKLLSVLRTLCHSPERFASLFVHDRGVILCQDVSSSKLN